jgi:hypothetical protein
LGKQGHRAEENYNICRRFGTEPDHDYVEWKWGRTFSDHHDHYESIKAVKEAAGCVDLLQPVHRPFIKTS